MKLIRRSTLRVREGSSDKVYEVDIVESTSGNGYLVNFRYGRYGKALTEGTKTTDPVDSNKARKVADSLLVAKINKGYQLVEGFDPITGQTIGAAPAPTEPTPVVMPAGGLSRDQRIIARLYDFAAGRADSKGYIDRYSLSRTVWTAGELRLHDLPAAINALLDAPIATQGNTALLHYSMAWALGRCANPAALPVLARLQAHVPEHLYRMACARVAPEPQAYLPAFDVDLDCVQTIQEIQALGRFAQMHFDTLDVNTQAYVDKVLHWHGMSDVVKQAAQCAVLADAEGDFLQKYLPADICAQVKRNEAPFPRLERSIDTVLNYHQNLLLDKQLEKLQSSFDLYQSIIKDLDIEALAGEYTWYIDYIRAGNVRYLWGDLERNLKRALQDSGKVPQGLLFRRNGVEQLCKDVSEYANINGGKVPITDGQLQAAYAILHEASAYDDVMQNLVPKLKVNKSTYYVKQAMSDTLKTQCEWHTQYYVERVFHHRFAALRIEALKPRDQLVERYAKAIVSLYTLAQVQTEHRALALAAIRHAPADEVFMGAFRKLYKLAEFMDDFEALAALNHRLETTTDSGLSWGTQRPFSRQTKQYFRRRIARRLKRVAKFQANHYPLLAKHIVLLANDNAPEAENSQDGVKYFPSLHALNIVLHGNSRCFKPNYRNHWYQLDKKESGQPESFSVLWQNVPEVTWDILTQCKAEQVNDFAYRNLHLQDAFLQQKPISDWLALVSRPYKNTALLAMRYLQAHLQELDVFFAVLRSPFADIRERALNAVKVEHFLQHPELLQGLLLHEDAALRQVAIRVLPHVQDRVLQQMIFARILPELFKAEPVEGFSDDLFAMVQALSAIHAEMDTDLLWRLLTARSKLAMRVGALILPCHAADVFSVKQLAILSKNPTQQVRLWAIHALQAAPQRVEADFMEAARLLDNRWDDARGQAIALFQTFAADFWTAERVVAVCDNVYEDVQTFGRDLVLRAFQQADGLDYLLKLSQHPASGVQLFVSAFLQEQAADKPEVITRLLPYFRNVLAQVNRGRVIKDRVIAFLFAEASKDEAIARLVATLFSEHSLSNVLADKGKYIHTLFTLQQRDASLSSPITVIEPTIRQHRAARRGV